ncbi:MAG: molybdopterin-synthase adenylyltransferase MoeB [Candidatus Eremiobacteraeota bacterium]|nr:molybdopterin-synthase adenylyltransferase MoeB [Candidatus Eremiobacteraeota bacterium]MBV8372907.1 molybdopterin-synthase adenylyltransferase MoeB [Candidatus Eremiobacteraeota bacterium]
MNPNGPRALRRYSRHLLIPEVGLAGQARLASSRVLVVGAGGLGSPALQYLAAAGVGRIGVADGDTVDETNLQRQTIFATADVGRNKATVAAERLGALNPFVAIDAIGVDVDARNARELVRLYDLVLDCTDRFAARYLINDACILEGKPDVYASIFRFDGQLSVFGVAEAPCYRCLYPQAPPAGSVPTCAEGGVLGALAGILGAWQASEALKVLLGIGNPLVGRLLLVETLDARVREVRFERDPDCALCGQHPSIREVAAFEDDDEYGADDVEEIDPAQLDATLARARLLDVREPHERALGTLPGAIEIPASQLESRMHELDSAQPYVVACRVGAKSRWAARRLREAGFRRLLHLRGGLLTYAAQHPDFAFF